MGSIHNMNVMNTGASFYLQRTPLLNYVRVPRQRTAPDRANKASASARRPTLGPPTNDANQDDVTSPPNSESLINVNKLVVTNSPLHQSRSNGFSHIPHKRQQQGHVHCAILVMRIFYFPSQYRFPRSVLHKRQRQSHIHCATFMTNMLSFTAQ